MFKIAIDLGYGDIKGVNENGKQIVFPSIVGSGFNRALATIFGGKAQGINDLVVKIEDKEGSNEFFVGELAKKECRNASFSFDGNKINHPNTKVLLATAAALLAPQDDVAIHLGTGLPLKYHALQKAEFEKILKSYKMTVQIPGLIRTPKTISFDKVTQFPQAASAVYYIFKKYPELYKKGSLLVVIDPGFKTTDVIVFEITDMLKIREDLSGTIEVGISMLHEEIQKKFQDQTGIRLPIANLDQILNEGCVFFQGNQLDYKATIEKSKQDIARLIKDQLKVMWGDNSGFFRMAIMVGGGSELLKNYLEDIHGDTRFIEKSRFANALGLMEILKMKEAREKKAI